MALPAATLQKIDRWIGIPMCGAFTLRVPETQAVWLASSQDYGHLWFAVRPATRARVQTPSPVSVQMLLGNKFYKVVK